MYFLFLKYILSTTVCLAQGQAFGKLPEGGEIASSLSYLRSHLCVVSGSPIGIFPPLHIWCQANRTILQMLTVSWF